MPASQPRAWLKYLWSGGFVGLSLLGYLYLLPYARAALLTPEVSLLEISVASTDAQATDLVATGYVEAELKSQVSAKQGGRIAKVQVSQGARVNAGDVLAELDASNDDAAIATTQSRALAAVARAQSASATVLTRQAVAGAAKLRADRERQLARKGASTPAAAEDLEADVQSLTRAADAADAQSKAASAEAQATFAEVLALQVKKRDLVIRAPIAGVVMNRPPQLGEFIGPQATDSGSFLIVDLDSLVVEADIPEARVDRVKIGAPAEVILDAYPDRRYAARVKEITPQVNRSKATMTARLTFSEIPAHVVPDMAARIRLLSKEIDADQAKRPKPTVIPAAAVSERHGSAVTFVVKDGVARAFPLQLGERVGADFVLRQGPAPGARVVANAPADLVDGARVRERTEP
jgi:RND family efflux transporter MFP subunit